MILLGLIGSLVVYVFARVWAEDHHDPREAQAVPGRLAGAGR